MTDTFVVGGSRYVRAHLREDEYEMVLLQSWRHFSRDWEIALWKPLLESRYGACRPDAALVRRDLAAWAVVEIELAVHTGGHYLPQFEKLDASHYGQHLLIEMQRVFPHIPALPLEQLLHGVRPEMLCIADESSDDLIRACKDFGFGLAVLAPFRGLDGGFALHARRFPAEYERSLSSVRHILSLSRDRWGGLYTARLPARFPNARAMQVRYKGEVSTVRVVEIGSERLIFMPADYAAAKGHAPSLSEVDPSIALFDLE